MAQSRRTAKEIPTITGWDEYKRLVLAELERLDQATEKLQEQSVAVDKEAAEAIVSLREELYTRISEKQKAIAQDYEKRIRDLKKEVDRLEKQFNAYKKEQQTDSTISSKWGLWAAVISIIGSLAVAIVSLIVALSG
jgi:sRNA-binding carbon storage regulator CsrA